MAALLFLTLLLSITGSSSATYCVCIAGAGNTADIDYACGAGADCSAILQNGACYQPNTAKSHCDYAVNSYYQKMGQVTGSCNFSGSATITNNLPTTVASGCTYPASPSQVTAAATPTGSTTNTSNSTSFAPSSTTLGFAPTDSSPFSPNGSGSLMHHTDSVSTILTTLFLSALLGLCV